MKNDIEKSVLFVSIFGIENSIFDRTGASPSFEITEEILEDVAKTFISLIEECTPEGEDFWDLFFYFYDLAVFTTLEKRSDEERANDIKKNE